MRAGFHPAGLNQLVDELEIDARLCAEHDGMAYTNDQDFGRIEGSRRCWLTMRRVMCRSRDGAGPHQW